MALNERDQVFIGRTNGSKPLIPPQSSMCDAMRKASSYTTKGVPHRYFRTLQLTLMFAFGTERPRT